jgi:hypothetical protein
MSFRRRCTPDRSKLFGSHGQRPWFHEVMNRFPKSLALLAATALVTATAVASYAASPQAAGSGGAKKPRSGARPGLAGAVPGVPLRRIEEEPGVPRGAPGVRQGAE